MKFVFFGSSLFSTHVLEDLKEKGVLPSLIITTPDKPKGRKLILTPNIVKTWAIENGIPVLDPLSLKKDNGELIEKLKGENADFFLTASYGKIIPKDIFDIPKYKTLNMHPSLLPRYRGASPLKSQILNDEKEIGTSIMVIDEGMDTGPVLAQRNVQVENWPLSSSEFEKLMATQSVDLFLEIIEAWLSGEIEAKPQDSSLAIECGKFEKEHGELDLNADPYKNLLKIKAFEDSPGTYFFTERNGKNMRVIVKDAKLEDNKLVLLRVVPEGKTEMSYEDFLRGNR